MCDVIKIRLKRGMKGEVGKETPKKRDGPRHIFMRSHMTLSSALIIFNKQGRISIIVGK